MKQLAVTARVFSLNNHFSCLHRRLIKLCACFVFIGLNLSLLAAQPPKLAPIEGLPPGARRYSAIAETKLGWVTSCSEGVLIQTGDTWEIHRIPGGEEITVLVPLADSFLAAGRGFCGIFKPGTGWQQLNVDDELYVGISYGGSAFISGRKGVYRVSPDGEVNRVLQHAAIRNVYPHIIHDQLYLFAVELGPLLWNGSSLQPVQNMDWASNVTVVTVQELEDGKLFITTSDRMFIVDGEEIISLWPEVFAKILRSGVLDIGVYGDHLIATMYFGGLVSISMSTGEIEWQLNRNAIGGNVYFSYQYMGGRLIGHSSGIFYMPNPDNYFSTPMPQGDLLSTARLKDGIAVCLTTGIFSSSGQPIKADGKIYSVAQTEKGDMVVGHFASVEVGDKTVKIGGREVSAIAISESGVIAAMQPHGVSLITDTDRPHLIQIDSITTSLVSCRDGFLIGTSKGIIRVAPSGSILETFGHGSSRVFQIGTESLGIDADGRVFSDRGTLIGKTPSSDIIGAAKWRGDIYLLSHLSDGTTWLGVIDPITKIWQPLDIPFTEAPLALAMEDDRLLVFGPASVLRTQSVNRLQPPETKFKLDRSNGVSLERDNQLPSSEDSITITTPRLRLGGWRNPTYEIKVESGPWEIAKQNVVHIPRLTWGINKLQLRATWAGLSSHTNIEIHRNLPWWGSAPMGLVYLIIAVGIGYGLLRWRTNTLVMRAQNLSRIVDERTAELLKVQKAREEFFSIISHEIRNPLNGVVGLCEMLHGAPTEAIAPRERVYLTTLHDCADQLSTLLDDVLDFTKIDRGGFQIIEDVFNAKSAIESAVRTVDIALQHCSVDADSADSWLHGDCGKIRQIIINLVTNALKYGIPMGARVTASISQSGTKSKLSISVANTGHTIPEAEIHRIFEGFTRGKDALERHIPGSGIGLAVSKKFARAMGGDLTATSQNGLTEFCLMLDLNPAARPKTKETEKRDTSANLKVLAIEDEAYNRIILGNILDQMGCKVDWAEDGQTAIHKIKTERYDLVMTDYMLPDIEGPALCIKIHEILKSRTPPIIAVTAYSTQDKIAEAKAAGLSGYVVKPITRQKIEKAVAVLNIAPQPEVSSSIPPEGDWDFTTLLGLTNGKQMIADFGSSLVPTWIEITNLLESNPLPSQQIVQRSHALRSRLLSVSAITTSDMVGEFEEAARRGDRQTCIEEAAEIKERFEKLAQAAHKYSEP